MNLFKTIIDNFKGNFEKSNFERSYILTVACVFCIFSIIGNFESFFLGFSKILILSTFLFTICSFFVIYLIVYTNKIQFSKYFLTISCILAFNALCFFNYGSKGVFPLIFVLFYAISIFLWKRKQLIIIGLVIILNLFVIFILELNYPHFFGNYPSEFSRITDVYLGVLFFFIIIVFVLNTAKIHIEKQYQKASEAERLKSAFLENISHEVRTPMNAIIGFSELLQRNNITDEKRLDYTNIIKDNSLQLLALLDDILDVSKLEAKLVSLNFYDCNMDEFMKNIHTQFQKTIIKEQKEKKVELIYKKQESNFIFKTDTKRLLQIIGKLIENAIKYTKNGYIEYGYELSEKNVITFYVKDTGVGIPQEYHNLLFHNFNKIAHDKKKVLYRGTGMGLYMSKLIVELLKGKIWFNSIPGEGSTFFFTIPVNNIFKMVIENKSRATQSIKWEHCSILIVEDDDASFVYLKELLSITGVNIERAEDAQEVIEKIKVRYNAILMDVNIPGANGYELIKQIKEIDPQIPIIVQTSYVYLDIAPEMKAFFNDYLPKPVDSIILMEILKKHLECK